MDRLLKRRRAVEATADDESWKRFSAEGKYQAYLDQCGKVCAYRRLALGYLGKDSEPEAPAVEPAAPAETAKPATPATPAKKPPATTTARTKPYEPTAEELRNFKATPAEAARYKLTPARQRALAERYRPEYMRRMARDGRASADAWLKATAFEVGKREGERAKRQTLIDRHRAAQQATQR